MADYNQNIGAYQDDFENDNRWQVNIGASQTQPPSFAATEKTIAGVGSLEVTPTIKVFVEPTISAAGSMEVSGITALNANNIGAIHPIPLTFINPGQDPGCDQGSAGPWSTVKPKVIDTLSSGPYEKVGPTAMDQTLHAGSGIIRGHEIPWYEAAHLLPRVVQKLGNIVSDQTINCELYNANRNDSITVSSVANNLGTGIVVSGVPATPFVIKSQKSLTFSLLIERVGDLTINGNYVLTLSTGETYTIYVTGSRIVMLPIRPEAPLREHLVFDTSIIEAVDGSEQRRSNRQYPRGMFELTYKEGQRKLEMILFDRQAKIVALPAWHQPSFLNGAHAKDATTVTVDTTAYANFYVGGYAVVLQDENYYDALKIKSMTSTTLEFESGLSYNYATNTQVMPLLTAYIESNSASMKNLNNQQNFNLRIHTEPENNDISDTSDWSTYNSKPFMDGNNLVTGGVLSESLRTKVFVIDNLTGIRTPVSAWAHNKRYSKKGWKTGTRQELWQLYELLYYLKGRGVSFYIPTFWKDIVPTQNMAIGTNLLTMGNIGYTVNAQQRWPKQVIRVHLKAGTILTRTIQNSSEVSVETEQLTLDASWPATYTPDDIERIEFLEKVRLDVDDIIIMHYNALGQAECVVPIKEVD
jgi:hypothetical protein